MVEEVGTSPGHTEMAQKQQVEEDPNALCKTDRRHHSILFRGKATSWKKHYKKNKKNAEGRGKKGRGKGEGEAAYNCIRGHEK